MQRGSAEGSKDKKHVKRKSFWVIVKLKERMVWVLYWWFFFLSDDGLSIWKIFPLFCCWSVLLSLCLLLIVLSLGPLSFLSAVHEFFWSLVSLFVVTVLGPESSRYIRLLCGCHGQSWEQGVLSIWSWVLWNLQEEEEEDRVEWST